MEVARPRQPAAGRRPPLHPEHAVTGRPLPRVTVTDALGPPSTSAACRPTLGRHLAHLRRRTPGRRPTSTHDRSRLVPPPTRPRAARGPSREAQTRAALPARPPGPVAG